MRYIGNTKLIQKHLGFLETEYDFKFSFQTFDDYNGFYGPIDTYSFYNNFGCFTLHHVVQRNEWSWFTSKKFSTNQYELLEIEINQTNYICGFRLFYSSVLKELASIIRKQIELYSGFFDICVIPKQL